ncbi:MAG: L,D-transpeptidase family protein [Hyphomicrobiales bacterium]|nr:L,D-transpeptidase family protein [Hyphomicrobiales bacterium]MDE2113359.1 L,D-transpeptidase family protein [Hyphomicrobiales bacterium]
MQIGGLTLPCALGPAGICAIKREGDGATPRGTFKITSGLWRADRLPRPRTSLTLHAITPRLGWCDAPGHRNYNRPVHLPFAASHESLWREDAVYDVVLILDHNQRPRRQNGGSAIFFHLAKPGFVATAGCVAIERRAMMCLLARLSRHAVITIGN